MAPDPVRQSAGRPPNVSIGMQVPTALFETLHSIGRPRRPELLRAFRAARRVVIAGERLDMGKLAARLGVDRTTLFRWVGNRDQLMAEVTWDVTEQKTSGSHWPTPLGAVARGWSRRWKRSCGARMPRRCSRR